MQTGDILLVDDDPDLLKLISLRLSSAGYRVRTADSGESALAGLAVVRPAAVITDLRMPGIDGLQLFEAIHRQHPALPVIILTAHGTIPDAVSATQRGVFGFLTKPFDSQELLQLVASALRLAGNAPMDSSEAMGEWKETLALLEAGFPRTRADLEGRFKILSQAASNDVCELVLQPKSAAARRLIPAIRITFATNDFSLRATELTFADGSRMSNEFTHSQLNPPLNEDLFTPKLADDFKIVEPLKR